MRLSGEGRQLLHIPYSRKYWQKLNLAVEPKITIAGIFIFLNLKFGSSVRDHHMYIIIM